MFRKSSASLSSSVNRLLIGSQAVLPPAFLCCDLQTAFAKRIPRFDDAVFESNKFSKVAELANAPFIITEQSPTKLGGTVPEIKAPAHAAPAVAKTKFSMIVPEVEKLIPTGTQDFVLWGIEAHVCVQQTVEDLICADKNNHVWIVSNATFSNKAHDRHDAMEWFKGQKQVTVTTSESILLRMIKDASHPSFRAISGMLKDVAPSLRQEQ